MSFATWQILLIFILFAEQKQSKPQTLGTREKRFPGIKKNYQDSF